MKRLLYALILLGLPLSTTLAQSAQEQLTQALRSFSRGSYANAVRELQAIQTQDKKILSSKFYLLGISHARLQQFTRSSEALVEAAKLDNKSADLYYELGQSLYAKNQLEEARRAFLRSFKNGFKKDVSLYYMGHISQILYEHDKAIGFYSELIKEESADTNMRQIAHFQRAESLLSSMEELPEKVLRQRVESEVLPGLQLALETDPEGDAVNDIKQRQQEIRDRYNLDPNKMLNGRPIPKKRFTLFYSQKLRFDDNITLANDQPTVTSTQKESYISDFTLFSSYHLPVKRRLSVIPEVRLNKLYHHDRADSGIYTNDRYTISPSVRNRIEYKPFGKMAAILFQLSHDYTAQDRNANKDLRFFARSWTYSLGHRIQLLPWGETTLRYRYKTYRAHSSNLDNDTHTVSLDQIFVLPNRHLAIFLINYDDVDNFNAPNNSTANLMLRLDYIINSIIPKTDLYFGLSYSALDTKAQSASRGTEPTWNPSLKISRRISPALRLYLEHAYNKKTSDDDARAYTKNATTLELRYDF